MKKKRLSSLDIVNRNREIDLEGRYPTRPWRIPRSFWERLFLWGTNLSFLTLFAVLLLQAVGLIRASVSDSSSLFSLFLNIAMIFALLHTLGLLKLSREK